MAHEYVGVNITDVFIVLEELTYEQGSLCDQLCALNGHLWFIGT